MANQIMVRVSFSAPWLAALKFSCWAAWISPALFFPIIDYLIDHPRVKVQ